MAFICEKCHAKDKVWLGCPFGYFAHAEWRFVKCEICGRIFDTSIADCKYYDNKKRVKKEGNA